MAKYVFLNMPGWGHVNPTLAVAQELIRRGHAVSYYLTEEFRETIQATGAIFHPYKSKLEDLLQRNKGIRLPGAGPDVGKRPAMGPPQGFLTAMLAEMQDVPLQVLDQVRAEQPDVIIYDFMCIWARNIIETLQVPAIITSASYASNEHFNLFERMRAEGRSFPSTQSGGFPFPQFKEFRDMLSPVGQLMIIFLPRFFQPMAETFDDHYLFVGPSLLPRHQQTAFPFEQLTDELPLLYISLGSTATNQPAFYKHCFEAFGDQPWQVVLSIGKYTDRLQLGPVPKNFLLSPYVPQLDILPRAQVFVTHAGANSVMESLYYGIPMVLIPQHPEQQMNARRAVELGLGILLDRETITAVALREAVERVVQNAAYRERVRSLQQITRDAGGYQRAADAIIQFTREHA